MTRPAALAALLLTGACADGESRLEAAWTRDSVSGRFAAPATAVRCDGGRLLVTALAGDTGFAVLVAGRDSAAGTDLFGSHPVADPGAGAIPGPGAALALRMPGEGGSRGYQGRDGTVDLAAAGPGWSGRFEGRLVSLDAAETLAVEGRFRTGAALPAACDDSAAAELP